MMSTNTTRETPKWGHYQNFHRELLDECKGDAAAFAEFFAAPVCVTEKIDGSNLAIHIRRKTNVVASAKPNAWGIPEKKEPKKPFAEKTAGFDVISIMGRKQPVWTQYSTDIRFEDLPAYGSSGALGGLGPYMHVVACNIANALHEDEIVVYGEVFRCHAKQLVPSWHPFGVKIPTAKEQEDTESSSASLASPASADEPAARRRTLHRLTTSMHKILADACADVCPLGEVSVADHEALFTLLKNNDATFHICCPPPILFVGTLAEAVETLHPMFIQHTNNRDFEGGFVVFESGGFGFKWKTGTWDEQPVVPSLDDFGFTAEEQGDMIAKEVKLYALLMEVFKSKAGAGQAPKRKLQKGPKAAKEVKEPTEAEAQLIHDVATAFERECSKMMSIADTPKKDRKPIAEKMAPDVIAECLVNYVEANCEPLYSPEHLRKKAPLMVLQLVMGL